MRFRRRDAYLEAQLARQLHVLLGEGEQLPTEWNDDGTTGYEFMNQLSLLQHHPEGFAPLADLWTRHSERPSAFIEEARLARQQILQQAANAMVVQANQMPQGVLALLRGWPSMFRAYLGEDERYRKCFAGPWYLTGDRARRDADGYYWFVGRNDDMIKSSGHLIGPFEVESALMEHPAVLEAGVIGKPDPLLGELVKAFVVLRPGAKASEDVQRDLLGFARLRLGAAVAPKELELVDTLPKTRSGKIVRRLLRARELGLPEGDTSTLEAA